MAIYGELVQENKMYWVLVSPDGNIHKVNPKNPCKMYKDYINGKPEYKEWKLTLKKILS